LTLEPWQATLGVVCETLLATDPSAAAWRQSVAERGSIRLAQQPGLRRARAELKLLLGLLESRLANGLLAGTWQRFSEMDRRARERHLRRLARHPLGTIRGGALALKRLAAVFYYGDADANGANPTWARLGYPGPLEAGPPGPQRSLVMPPVNADRVLDCDVLVVGSGVGGGIVAAELASAGYDVVVLERGPYLEDSDFTQRELEMLGRAYLDGGLGATADQGVLLLAGACLGGGSVVNYTTSLPLPEGIRDEWAQTSGLDLFRTSAFDTSIKAAAQRLSINQDHNRPSARDALMRRGLEALGWHVDRMPRNVVGCTQDDVCGYCGLGCVRGAKQSTVKACFEPTAAAAHRLRILVNCDSTRVRLERGHATGVEATDRSSSARLVVRARATILAAGAIGTPALLLRSDVDGGGVGQNLHLHPVTAVWGRFEQEVRPWTGTLQALYSEQFARQHGEYGVRFETTGIHPSFLAIAAPWHDPLDYAARVEDLAHTSVIGALLRDRSGGRVSIGRDGSPRVRYRVGEFDQRHVRAGVQAAARVLAEAGAHEVYTSQADLARWEPRHGPVAELMHAADRIGYATNRAMYVSFHQMGSCRMGSDPRTSVTTSEGEVHAIRDLFIADASLFPSASGVNPMLTIGALAHHVAGRVAARLAG
jgi:long-chain-alcohol oxidase